MGTWELVEDTLVLSRSEAHDSERMRITAVDDDRLVVARG
jgi:hypothetical protein